MNLRYNSTLRGVYYTLSTLLFLFFSTPNLHAQDLNRFQTEVNQIVSKFENLEFSSEKKLALFTGSSSIRLWETLADDFPMFHTLNTGFGGSTYRELAHYKSQLITDYKPDIVVVYEGDNDVTGPESAQEIFEIARSFYQEIMHLLPESNLYILAAKPSPLRWNLKPKYDELNQLMREYSMKHEQLNYLDIWSPMIGSNQRPMPHLFLSDSLHLNSEGYAIWTKTIQPILSQTYGEDN